MMFYVFIFMLCILMNNEDLFDLILNHYNIACHPNKLSKCHGRQVASCDPLLYQLPTYLFRFTRYLLSLSIVFAGTSTWIFRTLCDSLSLGISDII